MKTPPFGRASVPRAALACAVATILFGACAKDRFPPEDEQNNPAATGTGPGGGGVGGMFVPEENTEALCTDEKDNDGDGCADCRDFGCKPDKDNPPPYCAPPATPVPEDTDETCSDGIDNDGNGFVDCRDFSCSMNAAITVCENTDEACSDGVDNDCNGFVDCDDFGCSMNSAVSVCN